MNLSFLKRSNDQVNNTDTREKYLNFFFNSELHDWINADSTLKRNFEFFLNSLPNEVFEFFNDTSPLAFLHSSGSYSCAIPSLENHHVVLIFPETIQYLKAADPSTAFAILAHEIGHICLQHADRYMSSIEKQFEADEFASRIGFHNELIDFLENQEEMHLEIKMRLKELYSSKAHSQSKVIL